MKDESKFYFRPEWATKFGVEQAILLEHIYHHITTNFVKKSNPSVWISAMRLAKHFSFWSDRDINKLATSLVCQGALTRKRRGGMTREWQYFIGPELQLLLAQLPRSAQSDRSIGANTTIDRRKHYDRSAQTLRCIDYRKDILPRDSLKTFAVSGKSHTSQVASEGLFGKVPEPPAKKRH